MRALGLTLVVISGCGVTDPQTLRPVARVEGALSVPASLTGDAWLFLYRPGEGPPGAPAVPVFVTAVAAERLAASGRYVFGEVSANPWRLWGLLDVDQDFRGDVDVLAQPTAGDRIGAGVEFNLEPGRPRVIDYELATGVPFEPPAFHVENGSGDVFALDAPSLAGLTSITLVADPLERFERARTGFVLGLRDDDGDGRPDDADGDRIPDITFTALLRWLPKPGQHSRDSDVVVPLVLDPSPFLSQLGGDVTRRLLIDRLALTVLPRAQEVSTRGGRRTVEVFGSAPVGEYELVVLGSSGQFWRVPNQLGGVVASQALRFRFERAGP